MHSPRFSHRIFIAIPLLAALILARQSARAEDFPQLIDTEKKIVLAEKVLAEVTVKYEKTLAIEKSAIAKAGESKRAADDAYSIWQASLN